MSDLNVPSFYENETFTDVDVSVVKGRMIDELTHVIDMIKEQPIEHIHYTVGCQLVDSSGVARGFISQTTADFDLPAEKASTDHQVIEFNGVREHVLRLHQSMLTQLQMTYLETAFVSKTLKEVSFGNNEPNFISLMDE